MSDYLQHLKASGSRSWSPRSMRERHGRDFIEYRRHSYPNIARDFVYQQIDDESSDDKLRMGVTTRDESPPANVASDPRESSMQQQQLQGSNYPLASG
uniref:Bm7912 n=1 Tax=Brugia malayi TaxID=6279 RepID=A0A0H5RZI6_BRUMA|nr:Bm7912 [Brugia malayi]